jgi:hypothetical protein
MSAKKVITAINLYDFSMMNHDTRPSGRCGNAHGIRLAPMRTGAEFCHHDEGRVILG